MSNNCCLDIPAEGASLDHATLTDPVLDRPTITGEVTLDQHAAKAFYAAIKDLVDEDTAKAIEKAINALTPDSLGCIAKEDGNGSRTTLQDVYLTDRVRMDTAALTSIWQLIKPHVDDNVQEAITIALTGTKIKNGEFDRPTVSGVIVFKDEEAKESVYQAVKDKVKGDIDTSINSAVDALTPETIGAIAIQDGVGVHTEIQRGKLTGGVSLDEISSTNMFDSIRDKVVEVSKSTANKVLKEDAVDGVTLHSVSLTGGVLADAETITSLSTLVADEVLKKGSKSPVLETPRLDSPVITKDISFDTEALNALVSSIKTGVNELVKEALPKGSYIKSFSIVNDDLVLVAVVEGKEQTWRINRCSLCQSGDGGGSGSGSSIVITDGETITGEGSTDKPLKLMVTTTEVPEGSTGTELPVKVVGSRDMLMGGPTSMWVLPNGKKIPLYD